MTVTADLRVTRPRFRLAVDLEISAGEVVALLGPNGAGKTTTLRALAGLVPLTDGHITVDGAVWDRPPAVFVPPEHRPIGVVFQDYLLFAHQTALDNVAFGVRARGMSKSDARSTAATWLARVGLTSHAAARPRSLSGGQAQRVALARALATTPDLLLLDEPLAALDAGTRVQVRAELHRHLTDYAGHTLIVTHDPLDAMVLADRLVIVEEGRITQEGTPSEVARHPRTAYVADLVGLNLYRGEARGTSVTLDDGSVLVAATPEDGVVHLTFPPSAVSLHVGRPEGSPRNVWPVVVAGVEHHGHSTRVRLEGGPPVLADITSATVAELKVMPGQALWAAVKATEVRTYRA